jgi:hypothetical protein
MRFDSEMGGRRRVLSCDKAVILSNICSSMAESSAEKGDWKTELTIERRETRFLVQGVKYVKIVGQVGSAIWHLKVSEVWC